MADHRRISKGKKINPTFFVFCEGESEEAYISFLRRLFRVPIEIYVKTAGNRINQKYINNSINNHTRHPKDKIYLLYDIDVPGMLERLSGIRNSILLVSNPCFELWYILHYCNHTGEITTQACIEKFHRICKDYRKGYISPKHKERLSVEMDKAVQRAKKLTLHQNPSTSVYLIIEELGKI